MEARRRRAGEAMQSQQRMTDFIQGKKWQAKENLSLKCMENTVSFWARLAVWGVLYEQ